MTERRTRRRAAPGWGLDAVGGVLVGLLIAWTVVASSLAGGDPRPLVGLLLVAAACYATARMVGFLHAWAAPLAVSAAAVALALLAGGRLLQGPHDNPLGYSNAVGALYVLAAAAAAVVAVRSTIPALTGVAATAAVACALVPWLNGTDTAAVATLAVLPGALLAALRPLPVRPVAAAGAAAVGVAMLATAWLGAAYDEERRDSPVAGAVDRTLSERRPALWAVAVETLASRPLAGLGPGGFADVARERIGDEDAAWAHHELLQMGAETGVPGLLLTLALLAWCFVRLATGPGDAGNVVAVLGLTALGVHASVDYVLHFVEVVAAATVLVGAGSLLPAMSLRTTRPGR